MSSLDKQLQKKPIYVSKQLWSSKKVQKQTQRAANTYSIICEDDYRRGMTAVLPGFPWQSDVETELSSSATCKRKKNTRLQGETESVAEQERSVAI